MENKLARSRVLQQKKTKKPRTQPIKVVYISNPVKFKASPSEFRALVQRFTGQDAEFPDLSNFPATGEDFSADWKTDFHGMKRVCDDSSPDPVLDVPESSVTQYEPFDDVFISDQMIENLSGVWPSVLLFEPSPVDVLRRL